MKVGYSKVWEDKCQMMCEIMCRNPNLGLVTKAKACKGVG